MRGLTYENQNASNRKTNLPNMPRTGRHPDYHAGRLGRMVLSVMRLPEGLPHVGKGELMTTYIIKTSDGKQHPVAAKTRDEAIAKAREQGIKPPYTVERGKG